MVALLKENDEIKQNKPILNRALRRTIFNHALYQFTDANGYINLKIDKSDGKKEAITTFVNKQSAKAFLEKAVSEFNLCQKLSDLYPTLGNCFNYTVKLCNGACLNSEPNADYNSRVMALINKYSYQDKDIVIIDRGRDIDERSAILIKNGVFKGLGFYNLNYQIHNIAILETIITPMQNTRDSQHIIQNYIRKYSRRLKIIPLNQTS